MSSSTSPPGNNGDSPQALKSWWANFKKGKRKAPPTEVQAPQGIFGVPLKDSIQYANVAISLMDDQGKSFIYGYVPIVVAKCGVYLKEKATDVEGIFRLSGSAKRIKELQALFDLPPRYGKGLEWTGYTVHDAANVFRRYLNQLPQPIVPLEFYERFREPLRGHQSQAVGGENTVPAEPAATEYEFNHDQAIVTYQQLITQLPPLNRQLLLYILDLLSVFAFKAETNLMTSANLAAIFQPGMLSHPNHDMSPPDYRLSQDVIIFLIDNQDSFLIGMSGTAADEKTVREVQAGAQPATPSKSSGGLGRSVSNASGGGESTRKLGGIRRNISISSKNSRHSSAANTPVTPQSGGFSKDGGVHRSNTVPSKASPALSSTRAGRLGLESPTTPVALSPAVAAVGAATPVTKLSVEASETPTVNEPAKEVDTPTEPLATNQNQVHQDVKDLDSTIQKENNLTVVTTPKASRRISGLMKQTPSGDAKDGRQPNKLRKKRDPARSANSSTNSLSNADYIDSLPLPKDLSTPIAGTAPRVGDGLEESMGPSTLASSEKPSENTLKGTSPVGSIHSKSSVTDLSELDQTDPNKIEKQEKRHQWRFSAAIKNDKEKTVEDSQPQGTNKGAGKSTGSFSTGGKAQGADVATANLESVSSEQTQPSVQRESSAGSKEHEMGDDGDHKKGLFGRLRARMDKSREDHRAKEADKERAKSPPRDTLDHNSSKHSISLIANESVPSNVPTTESEAPIADAAAGVETEKSEASQKDHMDGAPTNDENRQIESAAPEAKFPAADASEAGATDQNEPAQPAAPMESDQKASLEETVSTPTANA